MRSEPVPVLYFSSFGHLRYGGQQSLYHLVCNLDRRAFRPHVAVPAEGELAERLRARGIAVSPIDLPRVAPGNSAACWRALRRIRALIREGGFRIVHTDGPRNTLYGGLASALAGIPLVWHIRSSDRDPYDRLLCALSAKLVLVADALRGRFDFASGGKFVTIHNGVDLGEFRAGGEAVFRGHLGVREGERVVACAGRVEPMKGQARLVEALGLIGNRKCNPWVLFCGEITDEAYREHCEEIGRRFGIADRVRFLGHCPDITGVLSAADLAVLPSLGSEAFPRAVIEAMALGKPVVATDVGGTREAVVEGVTGHVVPPDDAEALADRIGRLLADDAVRAAMGEAARRRAEEHFSIEQNVKATERLYRSLLNGAVAACGGTVRGGNAR